MRVPLPARLRRALGSRRRASDAEAELGELHRRLGWAPGHFYSPYADPSEVLDRRERIWGPPTDDLAGIDLREGHQLERLRALAPALARVPYGPDGPGGRFRPDNPNLSPAEAAVLYAQIADLGPRRIVEVGSGHSSCVILDARDALGAGEVTLIEPYPELLRSLLRPGDEAAVRIVARPVQDVDPGVFGALGDGDVLFIDSSHVAKAGGDVNHLLFAVLPALAPGVRVHVHDIPHPFEYPLDWVLAGRAWNEAYLMRAFLQFNPAVRIDLFLGWLAHAHADALREALPPWATGGTSSLWLVRS